jgi:hypothetical protein
MKNTGSIHYEIQEIYTNTNNGKKNIDVFETYPEYDFAIAESDLKRLRLNKPNVNFCLVEVTTKISQRKLSLEVQEILDFSDNF